MHHNKKRNVGLINEFFAREIAKNIIDKNYEAMNKAKSLYKKGGSFDGSVRSFDGSVRFNEVWFKTILRLCDQSKTLNVKKNNGRIKQH